MMTKTFHKLLIICSVVPFFYLGLSNIVSAQASDHVDEGIFLKASAFTEYLNVGASNQIMPEITLDDSDFDLQSYRQSRLNCAVDGLSKLYGRNELTVRWRCGKYKLDIVLDQIKFRDGKIVNIAKSPPVVLVNPSTLSNEADRK